MAETEAHYVAELALDAADPTPLDAGDIISVIVPQGAEQVITDLEQYLDRPRRKRGAAILHDANSLIAYVEDHSEGAATSLYADVDRVSVVAVLDGHHRRADLAGWGDHQARLQLRHTDNWQLWSGKDGAWLTQTQFAEHIEEGLIDIVEPDAADMLEVAQTFQANARVAFRSSVLLSNGQRQFTYEETIESKAGQKGTMAVPNEFYIGVAVFEGQTEGHKVKARLQHRIAHDQLTLRYMLERPKDVVRDAFGQIVAQIESGTGLSAFRGLLPLS